MAELPPLHQQILVNATQALASMDKVVAGLKTVGTTAETTATQVKTSSTVMGAGMFKAFAQLAAVSFVLQELRAMKDESIDLQVATARLNSSLTAIGVTSKNVQEQVFNSADAFASLGFQGSETIQAMGTLVTSTGSVSQAQKLMALSADYARDRHISMQQAAILLSRATTGNMKAFQMYGITLDKTLPKNQAIAKAFDQLNQRIGGRASAYAKTFAGQMDILKEKFDNIAQTIGAVLLPVFTKFVAGFGFLAGYISRNITALSIFGTGVLVVVGYLKLMALWNSIVAGTNPMFLIVAGVMAAGAAFAWLWSHVKIFREAVAGTLSIIIKLIGYITGGIAKLIRLLSFVPGGGVLKSAADQADRIALSIGKAAKSVDDLKNKKIGIPKIPKLGDFVKPGDKTGIVGNASGGDATKGGKGSKDTVQYVTVYASNTNDIAKKLSKAAKHGQPIGGGQ